MTVLRGNVTVRSFVALGLVVCMVGCRTDGAREKRAVVPVDGRLRIEANEDGFSPAASAGVALVAQERARCVEAGARGAGTKSERLSGMAWPRFRGQQSLCSLSA